MFVGVQFLSFDSPSWASHPRDLQVFLFTTDKEGHLQAKVSDLGFARGMTEATMGFEHTMAGGGGETDARNWHAPEVFGGHGVGRKADVWAFAMTLYELLTRGLPFKGLSMPLLMRALLLEDERPSLADVEDPSELLPSLVELMRDCWAKAPHERPSFEAIAARLAQRAPRRGSVHVLALQTLEKRIAKARDDAKSKFDAAWASLSADGGEELLELAAELALRHSGVVRQPSPPPSSPQATTGSLHAQATEAAPGILRAMRGVVEDAGGILSLPPPLLALAPSDPFPSSHDVRSTVKGFERAQEKIDSDYDGDCGRIVDMVRASGVFATPSEVTKALRLMSAGGAGCALRILRVKDRFGKPQDGYRDIILNVALAADGTSGHVAELQLHITDILAIKELSHISYEIGRGVSFA